MADRLKINFAIVHTDRKHLHHRASCSLPATPQLSAHRRVRSDYISEPQPSPPTSRRPLSQTSSYAQLAASISHLHLGGHVYHPSSLHHTASPVQFSSKPASPQPSAPPSVYEDSDTEEEQYVDGTSELESVNGEHTANERVSLVGDVKGKVALIVVTNEAAEHLSKNCGATKVYIIVTHGILSGEALKEIEDCPSVYKVVVTNTFSLPQEKATQTTKLHVIDVSAVLAEAIRRTHNGESISYLFNTAVV